MVQVRGLAPVLRGVVLGVLSVNGRRGRRGQADPWGDHDHITDCIGRVVGRDEKASIAGNQAKAAEVLGLQRSYLNRLIKDLGIEM